jgi:hypothetical protein
LTYLVSKPNFKPTGDKTMSRYPQTFPTEEAQHLYEMASSLSLRDNIAHAAHDTWWVGGFLLKFAVGEPDNHGAIPNEASAEEAIKAECTPEQYAQLQSLSVLAGITVDDLMQPGEGPEGLLDKIDINQLLANIQKIVALLKMLGLIP